MGTWGVAIFSDDLATDIRSDFSDLIGDGLTPSQATDKLIAEYSSSLDDSDEMSVFWISLACTQWKLGRLEERTKQIALQVIDSGIDLKRWDDPKNLAKRSAVLAKVRTKLTTPQPPAKRIPRTIKASNDWHIGEMIGFRLLSGKWTLFRVIGHHTDKGGQSAICELMNWIDDQLPPTEKIAELQIKKGKSPKGISQFLFQEPKKKKDQPRVQRMGTSTQPFQKPSGYTVLVWPYVDEQLDSIFDIR